MKKKIILTFALATTIALAGCSGGSPEEDKGTEQTQGNQKVEKEEDSKKDELPIKLKEIPYEIVEMKEPDSIGNVYMVAEYTNNTEYPITGFNMTVNLKDSNEKTYLMTYDTVMPGETSSRFEAGGPATGSHDDYEVVKIEITAQKSDDTEIMIEYDLKLDKYQYMEIDQ